MCCGVRKVAGETCSVSKEVFRSTVGRISGLSMVIDFTLSSVVPKQAISGAERGSAYFINVTFLLTSLPKLMEYYPPNPKFMKIQKTNAARLLDAAGISYELIPYEVDEDNLAADHVAAELGEPIEQVFKTLVLRGDKNGLFVCVMPGDMEVDLKVAAKISGNKNCAMIHMKELLPETGYIRGGCSPIGMKKPLPTFIYESALLYDYIYVSAGMRGLQIKIAPKDLIDFIGADIYPI